ncbi:MAG: sugar ABC transporter permease, partial [Bacteroidetes bacterium]|nr:sugar ABC transporter permease [Bacteroidota bacterium]
HVLHIILPALRPTLLFIFVVSSASAVKLFTELYVLIPGVPMDNKTLVAFLYRSSFERFEFGYGSAVAVVLFMLTAGLSYLNIRLMEERQ